MLFLERPERRFLRIDGLRFQRPVSLKSLSRSATAQASSGEIVMHSVILSLIMCETLLDFSSLFL